MREFTLDFDSIFHGLVRKDTDDPSLVRLISCHNLQPIKDNYVIHKPIIGMNEDAAWGGTGAYTYLFDLWIDYENDNWVDDKLDLWVDY